MSRAATTPRRRGSESTAVRVLLIVGFLLAVGASVVMVVADSDRWLRIAVLLALWAALIAAFAVVRSRRQARAAELRQEEATRIYELELHREISARREFEAGLVERTRSELEAKHKEELDGVRDQLDRLTTALSRLLDGDLLVERLTLSAESTRVRSVGESGLRGGLTRQQLITSMEEHTAGPGWGPHPAVVYGPEPPPGIPIRPAYLDHIPENAPQNAGFAGSAEDTTLIPRITDDVGPPAVDEDTEGDDHAGGGAAAVVDVGEEAAVDAEPATDTLVDLGDTVDADITAADETTADETRADETPADPVDSAGSEILDTVDGVEDQPAPDEPEPPVRHLPIDRPDAPSTAWTLQHRRVTPAAPHTASAGGSDPEPADPVEPDAAGPADMVEPDATEPADADPAPDESYDHEVGQTGSVTVAELLRAYGGGGTGRRRRRLDDDDQA